MWDNAFKAGIIHEVFDAVWEKHNRGYKGEEYLSFKLSLLFGSTSGFGTKTASKTAMKNACVIPELVLYDHSF